MTDHKRFGRHERALAKIKETAGSIVGSDDLKEEGKLHREHADAVTQMAKAEALAAQREAEAAVVARQQELQTESERLIADELREAETDQVERSRRDGLAEIEAEAIQKEVRAAVRRAEQQDAVEDALVAADYQRRQAEISADQTENQAQEALHVAGTLDDLATDLPKGRS